MHDNASPRVAATVPSAVVPWSYSRLSTVSILRHLPPRPVVDYLVAVYFNTVHWFVVVAHEGHFLHHYRQMMDLYAQDKSSIPDSDEDFTFALLILTVVALGGRYASVHAARRRRCTQAFSQSPTSSDGSTPSDIATATCRLFAVLRNNSTDNLTCGTLATVQSMLLLGNLYLYHGHSNLAWTHTASTVRVAQALELHKEDSEMRWTSPYYQRMDLAEKRQLKWRLFWAIHTSDRFLAMCYGLPPLISDEDCVADIPREDCIYPPTGSSSFLMLDGENDSATGPNSTTLLTYQTHKLKFYTKGGLEGVVSQASKKSSQSRTDQIVNHVRDLDRTLRRWYSELPGELRVFEMATRQEKEEENVHERRKRIKNSIYGMQALLLQLAYDHALVLIHRPILTLKINERQAPPKDMLCWSISTCWRASLRISNIGWHPVFDRNQHAHAVSFVGVHLFAAGVILGAFAGSDPLSRLAFEAKRGLSRVIQMQRHLKAKVIVSAQSLAILEKLAYDVMRKEANRMFGEGSGELDNGSRYPELLSKQQEDHPPTLQEPLPAAPTSNGSGAKNDKFDLSSIYDMQSNEDRLLFDGLLPDTLLGLGSSMAEVDKRECFWTIQRALRITFCSFLGSVCTSTIGR
ncbi:fungal-specific transcription factor domain-containing protein [Aspergillus novoparasiticus]|uniref:Fungal-specific transcription factor domain-containing protein n=1 Tax=Aspergillus novoparasiticus TaxID=986946 RepID=A0A5N6EKJ7_9EURO|nr:fungal-specific transcription factor domain-containing protein [Aspergillus novoparasiticus]